MSNFIKTAVVWEMDANTLCATEATATIGSGKHCLPGITLSANSSGRWSVEMTRLHLRETERLYYSDGRIVPSLTSTHGAILKDAQDAAERDVASFLQGEVANPDADKESIATLKEQRDELVAALENYIASHVGDPKRCGHEYGCCCPLDHARGVIAKVKRSDQ